MEALDVELTHLKSSVNLTTVCPYYVDTGLFTGIQTKYGTDQWLLYFYFSHCLEASTEVH